MRYNDGAEIVPIEVFQGILRGIADFAAIVPENYARVQLLTDEAYRDILFKKWDRLDFPYGSLSGDYPLCEDIAEFCRGDVQRAALRAGVAVRLGFGTLNYTKNAGLRHAINYRVIATTHDVLYFEPQTDAYLASPKDCQTMDEFRL